MVTSLRKSWQNSLKWLRELTHCVGASKPAAVASPSLADLDAAKVIDRKTLLAKPPEIAQLEASQVLHPELWQVAEQAIWTERLSRSDRHSAPESEE
jgi:hypothetical protein